MSEVPAKTGWWVWSETPNGPKSFVKVLNYYCDELHFEEIGRSAQRQLDQGYWHCEVDPDEPRAEPAGGLTADEIGRLKSVLDRHDSAPTLIRSVANAFLTSIGFTRLTDAEIFKGVTAADNAFYEYMNCGCEAPCSCVIDYDAGSRDMIAAFRRAVAEAKKPKGDDPC